SSCSGIRTDTTSRSVRSPRVNRPFETRNSSPTSSIPAPSNSTHGREERPVIRSPPDGKQVPTGSTYVLTKIGRGASRTRGGGRPKTKTWFLPQGHQRHASLDRFERSRWAE